MAQGLNIDEILLGLDEEKTAEEVFSDNLIKDKKDTGKDEEKTAKEAKDEEKTAEEAKDKTTETDKDEEKTAEEDKDKTTEKDKDEEKTAEEDKDKTTEKDKDEEKTAGEKKDLTTDEEDSRLKKLAAEMGEGGQILARSFVAELNKIASEDYNEDEVQDPESEKTAEDTVDPAVKIITTLRNRYFGE